MARWITTALLALLVAGAPRPLEAQPTDADELDGFIHELARLWLQEDVDALVDRTAASTPLLLDVGSGAQTSQGRHAAAALRELFDERETLAAAPIQVTVADTDRPSGFGHLSWVYRDRGAPGEQTRSLYVAVAREDGRWTITELRLMP